MRIKVVAFAASQLLVSNSSAENPQTSISVSTSPKAGSVLAALATN
jgi:hypothetical protein